MKKLSLKRVASLLIAIILAMPVGITGLAEEADNASIYAVDEANSYALDEANSYAVDDAVALDEAAAANDATEDDTIVSADDVDPEVGEADDAELGGEDDSTSEDTSAAATYWFLVNDELFSEQAVKDGEALIQPDDPTTPEGSVFVGWFLEDGTQLFTEGAETAMAGDSLVNVWARFEDAAESSEAVPGDEENTDDLKGSDAADEGDGPAETGDTPVDEENNHAPVDTDAIGKTNPEADAKNSDDTITTPEMEGEEGGEDTAHGGDVASDEDPDEKTPNPEKSEPDENVDGMDETTLPVRVAFTTVPEEAVVRVFGAPDSEGHSEEIAVEEDGLFLLLPGVYTYSATAEGYEAVDGVVFTVAEEALDIAVTLEAIPETPEHNEEDEQVQPVVVTFVAEPEIAVIAVYPAAAEGGAETIAAQEDGTYLLLPGEYIYNASAEGYVPVKAMPFTVGDEPLTISIELEAVEGEMVPFNQSKTLNGVIVRVQAEAGVFPADAELSVTRVPVRKRREADAAIEEVRDEDVNVAVSYTFDIKVIDAEGNELQPAEGQSVSVSFALGEVADGNLETSVYHVTEEGGALTAQALDVTTEVTPETGEETTAMVETDGFSIYTVEFTYNNLEYVMQGDTEVALSEILDAVGLTGEVTAVEISNESLFSASYESGAWIITAHRAFSSTEWMKVTINGVVYEIAVTDQQLFIVYIAGSTEQQITLEVEPGDSIDNVKAKIQDKISVPVNQQTLYYNETLLENGHTLADYQIYKESTLNLVIRTGTTYAIAIASGIENGTVTANTDVACEGETITLTVTPEDGYALISGSLTVTEANGDPVDVDGTNQFTMPANAVTVSATFSEWAWLQNQIASAADGAAITLSKDYIATADDARLTIPANKTVTLDLNGHTLDRGLRNSDAVADGNVITVNGTLTVKDSKPNAGHNPGISYKIYGQTTQINGGIITGGHNTGSGGGVVVNGGTLNLQQGNIVVNASDVSGGGVVVNNGGTFNLSGVNVSFVSGNNAANGGGVYVANGGVFNMTGGDIKGNTASEDGGGVYTAGTFNLSGGCINFFNTAASGGVYVYGGTINLSGNPDISNNKLTNATTPGNVYLNSGAVITVTGNLTNTSYGVTRKASGVFTSGLSGNGTAANFTSEDSDYVVRLNESGEAALRKLSTVTISSITNGSVTAKAGDTNIVSGTTKVVEGDVVTLTATPTTGYVLGSWIVTDEDGKAVTVTDNTFAMPDSAVTVSAAFVPLIDYVNAAGVAQEAQPCHVVSADGTGWDTGWYAVTESVTVSARIKVTGDVNLILCDGKTLTASKGIHVSGDNSLTIYGQTNGTGTLTINGVDQYNAGIGCNEEQAAGTITINGGTVTVTGGGNGAGIGGGRHGYGGNVTVNGGTVTAKGGSQGAGIGGGSDGAGGNVTINGGVVTANGGDRYGAGIGGGYLYEGGTVTINGGTVTAKGGYRAAGIGGSRGAGGNITINGGVVTANGGENAAGIGGGSHGAGGTITINGGTVEATGGNTKGVSGEEGGAGIGGGWYGSGGTIEITGGKVTANGKDGGAGIGPGYQGSGGTASLAWTKSTDFIKASSYSGTVTATKHFDVNTVLGDDTILTAILPTGEVTVADIAGKTLRPRVGWLVNADDEHIAISGDSTVVTVGGKDYYFRAKDTDVTLTVTPETGYAPGSLTYTPADGDAQTIATAVNSDGTYTGTFTMPDSDVTVSAGYITEWAWLNAQFAGASTDQDAPTQITLQKDFTAVAGDARLTVPKGRYVTLDLNGHTLDRNLENAQDEGEVIYVKGTLTVQDSQPNAAHNPAITYTRGSETVTVTGGVITGGKNNNSYGGGVFVGINGTFTLSGGSITGNETESSGGGLYVGSDGTFNLESGSITGNTASRQGGGVCVTGANSAFTMTGGSITGNNANNGGGVFVGSNSTFNLESGSITHNTATNNGGGVYLNESNNSTLNVKGAPTISGNTKGTGDTATANNVYLPSGKVITVTGALTTGATIGVTTATLPAESSVALTSGYTSNGNTAAPGNWFIPDNSACAVGLVNGEAALGVPHGVTVSAADNGNSVAADLTQAIQGQTVTLTATPKDASYKLISLTWKAEGGEETGIDISGEGPYTFTMPDFDVTVSATFVTEWSLLQAQLAQGGTITLDRDYTCVDQGEGRLVVPSGKTVTLDLNGHTLDRGLKNSAAQQRGNVIYVQGNLTVKDSGTGGTITGGKNNEEGGGVIVNGGVFNLQSGSITGNTADYDNDLPMSGGGVLVQKGTLTQSGGSITGNTATQNGGGVCVDREGTFIMSGGTITGNTTPSGHGGGVSVITGTFTMTSGSITGNSASRNGGGVLVSGTSSSTPGTFTLSGGEIRNNTAGQGWYGGGVYVSIGTFNFYGNPVISGNVVGGTITGGALTGGTANNVGLYDGKTITLTGVLTDGADIHVYNTGVVAVGGGDPAYTPNDVDANRFFSDRPGYGAWLNGEKQVVIAQEYAVNVDASIANGTVTPDRENACAGETVALNITPANGYMLDTLTVTDANGAVQVTNNTFTMPAGNVTVSATFITEWSQLKALLAAGGTVTLDKDYTCVDQTEGPLEVPENVEVTLDLNGHKINRNRTRAEDNGNIITVNGTLTVTDSNPNATHEGSDIKGGIITGGKNTGNGGGVYVSGTNSAFTLSGGTITGNRAAFGGGVYVNNGAFTMTGGSITGNTATSTSNNTTAFGGGVYVYGTFTMTGGSITGNNAPKTSGITAASGGGVYVSNGSTFNVSGDPVVTGNSKGQNDDNNVYLSTAAKITAIGVLSPAASIGVSMENPGAFTTGLSGNGNDLNFTSDKTTYAVGLNNEREAVLSQEKTTVTFNANDGNGDQIKIDIASGTDITATLRSDLFTSAGCTFKCWSTVEDGTGTIYDADIPVSVGSDAVDLYAQWYTNVTLTSNSGAFTYDGGTHTVSGYTPSISGLTFPGVTASGSGVNPGSYPVTFSGVKVNETEDSTGQYLVTKTVNGKLTINPAPAPAPAPVVAPAPAPAPVQPSITIPKVPASVKAKAKRSKVTVSWKKIKKTKKTKALLAQIKGIEVQYSTDPTFASDVNTKKVGKKKTKVTLKLQKKTVYYIRVRYTDGTGGVSNWSKVRKVKTK